ncbi:MAG: hypothetical protein Q9M14_06335 [Mariprofundaceae bacterium]|nr:hypothetical protein [Mariprofundaceae bacterium]
MPSITNADTCQSRDQAASKTTPICMLPLSIVLFGCWRLFGDSYSNSIGLHLPPSLPEPDSEQYIDIIREDE